MIETVKFKDKKYPEHIADGFHAQYIFPIAKKVCIGQGLDIGCGKLEWAFPESIPVDKNFGNGWDALNLPLKASGWDYIFSSHCLEHLLDYMECLRYWTEGIRRGGILFLYLPHEDCEYWRPWMMPTRKHLHQFYPRQMMEIYGTLGYKNVFCSERDLAYSFAIYGEKA